MNNFKYNKINNNDNFYIFIAESSSEDKENENKPQSVFGKENLSDCGLTGELLSHFCNSDRARIKVVESLKYSSEGYTWS